MACTRAQPYTLLGRYTKSGDPGPKTMKRAYRFPAVPAFTITPNVRRQLSFWEWLRSISISQASNGGSAFGWISCSCLRHLILMKRKIEENRRREKRKMINATHSVGLEKSEKTSLASCLRCIMSLAGARPQPPNGGRRAVWEARPRKEAKT